MGVMNNAVILLQLLLAFRITIGVAREGEHEQRLVKTPFFSNEDGVNRYDCIFHHSHLCAWSMDGRAFDPTDYHYHYRWKKNCTIKADDDATDKLHTTFRNLSCIGYIDYPKTTIKAGLNLNVELKCQSHLSISHCVWKRNNASVYIGGKDSNAHYHSRSNNCSIRIDSIENKDYGEWTCSEPDDDEIIEAYTLVFNNEQVIEIIKDNCKSTRGIDATAMTPIGNIMRSSTTSPVHKKVQREQQQVVESPYHSIENEVDEYRCVLKSFDRCTWLKNGIGFDPAEHGYHSGSGDNCIITAVDNRVSPLRNISCIGYISYTNTIVETGLNVSVELKCQSTICMAQCIWKRDDAKIYIRGRYSYAYRLNRSHDCSIRVDSLESVDYGEWTCSDHKVNDIISAYTLVFNDEVIVATKPTPFIYPVYQYFSLSSMIPLYVCIFSLLAIIFVLILIIKSYLKIPSAAKEYPRIIYTAIEK